MNRLVITKVPRGKAYKEARDNSSEKYAFREGVQFAEKQLKLLNIVVDATTFVKGDKVSVLVGAVWHHAEIERLHPSNEGYDCGTSAWSTYFPFNLIKPI